MIIGQQKKEDSIPATTKVFEATTVRPGWVGDAQQSKFFLEKVV
jgi:hypothetical protein